MRPSALLACLVLALGAGCGDRTPTDGAATAASSSPSAARLWVLVAEQTITGQVSGGGYITNGTVERFLLVAADGSKPVLRHSVDGGVVAQDGWSFDGRRLAYWRVRAPGTPPLDLVVWDPVGDTTTLLLTLASELPSAAPLWSAGGREIVASVSARALNAGTRPAPSRLVAVDVRTRAVRELWRGDGWLKPVYADDAIVAGFGFSHVWSPPVPPAMEYVVLDVRTGDVRSRTGSPSFADESRSDSRGIVFGLERPFESAASLFRVWPAADYSRALLSVPHPRLEGPLFWPGRSQLVVREGHTLRAIDYATGANVVVLQDDRSPLPVAFDADGRYLLTAAGTGHALFDASSTPFAEIASARIALPATGIPVGLVGRP